MASITKRNNSYRITVSNGRDIYDRQIIKTTTWKPDPNKTQKQNQRDLQRFAMDFEDRVHNGKVLKGEKMTYLEFSRLWLKEYAHFQMEQTTIEHCERELETLILPAIGHLKLADIQPLHLQMLYNELYSKGYERNGKHYDYKPNSIKRIHQTISSSLSTAVQWQLIESNPCQRVRPPKAGQNQSIKYFTLEQTDAFLKQLDRPYTVMHCGRVKKDGTESAKHYETKAIPLQYKVLFYLAVFGGFRRGELIALTWEDIHFEEDTITIDKASARTKSGVITKAPKTVSSNRTISIPVDVMKLVETYKKEWERYRETLATYWAGSNHLFIQNDGRQMDLSTPNKVFQRIIRQYNAEHEDQLPLITLHGLRHTSATLLISQNIDVKTVSHRLGHSETSTTMNIYAHALEKQDRIAADSLGSLFRHDA